METMVDLAHPLDPEAKLARRPSPARRRVASTILPAPAKVMPDPASTAAPANSHDNAAPATFVTHWTRALHDDLFRPAPTSELHRSPVEGDADKPASAFFKDSAGYPMSRDARTDRSFTLGAIILVVLEALLASAGRAYARYRQWRRAMAVYDALHELDDRTLGDLGLHRSEIGSVAAESTREAERTRLDVRLACRRRW